VTQLFYQIPGYVCFGSSRPAGGGGGVLIYILSSAIIDKTSFYSSIDNRVQLAAAQIKLHGYTYLIATLYNSTGNLRETNLALNILSEFPTDIMTLVTGDFNVDILHRNTPEALEFLGDMALLGLTNTIDIVTRPSSGTCLDNIFISHYERYANILPGVIDQVSPDHHPVFLAATLKPRLAVDTAPVAKSTRRFTIKNKKTFIHLLMQLDWTDYFASNNVDELCHIFYDHIYTAYNLAFPLVLDIRPRTTTTRDSWYDSELAFARKKINTFRRQHRYFLDNTNKLILAGLRRDYKKLLISKQANFYEELFGVKSMKDRWKKLNELLGRNRKGINIRVKQIDGSIASDKIEVADILNLHFASIGVKTVNEVLPPDEEVVLLPPLRTALPRTTVQPSGFSISHTNLEEISKTINDMNTNMANSLNMVPSQI
jgi:hypothetical protein